MQILVVRRSLLLAALLAAPLAERATAQEWERIGPDGGSVCALAASPSQPRTIYAGAADFGGVFRSLDRGLTWSFAGHGLGPRAACSLAVDARNSSLVWAVAGGQIFRSADGGANWRPLASPEPAAYLVALLAHPNKPRRLLLASVNRVWRSEDGGSSWQSANAGLDGELRQIVLDPLRPDRVFAATFHGVYRSTDGGRHWSPKNQGLPGSQRFVHVLAIDSRDGKTLYAALHPGGLFRSTDGGDSWRFLRAPWPSYAVAAMRVAGRTLYVGTYGLGLYRSGDGGRSFPDEDRRLRDRSVAALLSTNYALLAGTERGLLRSASGAQWLPSQVGLRARSISHFAIDPREPERWYFFDLHENVLRSLRGGASWRHAGGEIFDPAAAGLTSALTVDPLDSRVFVGIPGGLGLSEDAARSWRMALTASCIAPDLVLSDSARRRIFVGAHFLIGACGLQPGACYQFRSGDAGLTFSCATDRLPPGAGYTALDPANGNLYAISQAGLHRSLDGGDTWSLLSAQERLIAVAVSPVDSDVLYALAIRDASGALAVLRSGDGGLTWSKPSNDRSRIDGLFADPFDLDRLYALSSPGLLLSTDGGASWRPLGTGAEEVVITDVAFDPRRRDVLYAASAGGGLLRLRFER